MDTFSAIADPVRRDVLELLRKGPLTAGAIAATFPISRPAISRHLRLLRESGLVVAAPEQPDRRERLYRLNPAAFAEIENWLLRFRVDWSTALDALETEVHRTRRERMAHEAGKTDSKRSTA
jgi:DNA-binding transcriptional ArsR family regulator